MRIILLNIDAESKYCSNKDIAGGYGTSTQIGTSLRAKLLELRKKKNITIPLLDFGYLAGILRRSGHTVEYKNVSLVENPDCDLIFIHSSIVDYKNEIAHIQSLKKGTRAKIGVIGPFASAMPQLYSDADFIIIGEPEATASGISDGVIPSGIVKSEVIYDLDKLPFPDWDGFPISNYSYRPTLKETPFLTIQSSRGCPYSCSYYCPYTVIQGTKYRARSPANVVDEIVYLKNKYGVKALQFRDPIFSFDQSRVEKIANEIISRNIDIKWLCETRLDLVDKDLLNAMYNAGLRAINVGIESFNEDVLKKSKRKPVSSRHQEEMINFCRQKGIKVLAFYILGLENDNRESILETIKYAKKLNTYLAQFTISTPYPGTKYYEETKDRLVTHDYELFDANHLVFKHDNITAEELCKLKEWAFISYYFRFGWLFEYMKWSIRELS